MDDNISRQTSLDYYKEKAFDMIREAKMWLDEEDYEEYCEYVREELEWQI